jgi:hypothetical protein
LIKFNIYYGFIIFIEMPQVNIIGEITDVSIASEFDVSLSYAFVSGNNSWMLRNGSDNGETARSAIDDITGKAVLNHPIDLTYETSSSEGWPCLVVEVCLTYTTNHTRRLPSPSLHIPLCSLRCVLIGLAEIT